MGHMEGTAGLAGHGGKDQDREANVLASVENRKFVVDSVDAAIAGERAARSLLSTIRHGIAPPDAVLASLQAQLAADGTTFDPMPRLRAWARRLQKDLEAAR